MAKCYSVYTTVVDLYNYVVFTNIFIKVLETMQEIQSVNIFLFRKKEKFHPLKFFRIWLRFRRDMPEFRFDFRGLVSKK